MSGDQTLDTGALVRLDRIGGSEFVVEMIELFLENAPQRLGAAREGFEAGDTRTLHRSVHSLKSTAANVGARALQAQAAKAEAQASGEELDGMSSLLDDLEQEYEKARDALEAERDRRQGAGGPTEERP